MAKAFSSFSEFYPFYLEEHADPTCKLLHFIGTWLVVLVAVVAFILNEPKWLWLMPLLGYGFAWVGHFFFERNRPATFKHPLYSLLGDFVMWKDIMTGKVKI
ncbi:MAG: Mpo1-like protein [Lysobacterales bacterium]